MAICGVGAVSRDINCAWTDHPRWCSYVDFLSPGQPYGTAPYRNCIPKVQAVQGSCALVLFIFTIAFWRTMIPIMSKEPKK